MARVVDIDEVVPEDVILKYRGTEYRVPGDPPTEYIFALWAAAQRAQTDQPLEEQVETMESVHNHLLRVFQVCDPNLQHLPFGFRGLVAVSQLLFGLYGLVGEEPDGEEDGEPDPPKAPAKRSRRSSGSRS